MTHRTLFPPPDENRALEQLERLHREILRARRDRERAGADFEGFVREIQGAGQDPVAAAPAGRRVPRPIVPAAERADASHELPKTIADDPQRVAPEPRAAAPAQGEARLAATPTVAAPAAAPAAATPSRGRGRGLLVTAAVMLLGAVVALVLWQRSQQPAASPEMTPTVNTAETVPSRPAAPRTAPAQPPAAPAASPAATTPQPASPAAAVSPATIELTTVRPVWMRVIVDGERVLEREVPAGQHMTYTPASGLVVRAGDAGAVRVKIGGGPEEVLGRDAFPATRRFTLPKP